MRHWSFPEGYECAPIFRGERVELCFWAPRGRRSRSIEVHFKVDGGYDRTSGAPPTQELIQAIKAWRYWVAFWEGGGYRVHIVTQCHKLDGHGAARRRFYLRQGFLPHRTKKASLEMFIGPVGGPTPPPIYANGKWAF